MKRNPEKAKDFAKRHEIPFWFDSADDLLKNQTINTIYITAPPKTYLELVKNVCYLKSLCI
jgi:predicted dehydrogenase